MIFEDFITFRLINPDTSKIYGYIDVPSKIAFEVPLLQEIGTGSCEQARIEYFFNNVVNLCCYPNVSMMIKDYLLEGNFKEESSFLHDILGKNIFKIILKYSKNKSFDDLFQSLSCFEEVLTLLGFKSASNEVKIISSYLFM